MLRLSLTESTLTDLVYILEEDGNDYTPEEILDMIPERAFKALSEAAKRTIVVRAGKRKIKFVCGKGFKLIKKGQSRRCQKMASSERMKKSRQSKRSARKAKAKKGRAMARRGRSMRKRAGMVKRR